VVQFDFFFTLLPSKTGNRNDLSGACTSRRLQRLKICQTLVYCSCRQTTKHVHRYWCAGCRSDRCSRAGTVPLQSVQI